MLKFAAAAVLAPRPGAAAPDTPDAGFYALLARLAAETESMQTGVAWAAALYEALIAFEPDALSFDARLDYDGILEGLRLELSIELLFDAFASTASPYVISQRHGAYLSLDTATADGIARETRKLRGQSISSPMPDFIIDATLTRLAAARAAAPAPLGSALDEQIAALKELRRGAPHEAGIWHARGGAYGYLLALQAGASRAIAPQAAHDEGLKQVRELTDAAEPILRKLGLTQGTVGARLHALGRDARYLYSDDDAGRARAVATMNARLARVRPLLAPLFTGLSPGAITVEIAGPGKIGYRVAPSYDGSKPGAYYVDLREIGRRPSWSLPSVVHHETLPGHLLQLPLQEHANPVRLRYTPNAFFEGWAIYAEQLAGEMGLFEGDELARLGMLQSLLVRAARLVIDTGIHFKCWSREDAIARFFDIAGDAPDTLENEIDRIVVQPGLTAGPALGWRTILNLREAARAKAGFSLTGFHEALLRRGAMRLSMIERAVRTDLNLG